MPLVLQYNKRDLPELTPIEFMDRALNARKVDAIPAVAVRGEGVLETFSAILLRTMQDLATRYQIVETTEGPDALAVDAGGHRRACSARPRWRSSPTRSRRTRSRRASRSSR